MSEQETQHSVFVIDRMPDMSTYFDDHLLGCLLGVAIGDGMGAPVEGLERTEIRRRFPTWDWTRFLPSQEWKPKGEGRITDDTLMTEALIRAYQAAGTHLDAYGFRDFLLPEYAERQVWVPELQRETAIIDRLNFLEKYALFRLRYAGAEPRVAGLGNGLNCAIAMFIMPVGAVNAGDPYAAYHEAAELGMAEAHSYAVEGAAALAAAYAAALGRGAGIDGCIAAARTLAREGTRASIDAVVAATDPADPFDRWAERVLQAILPFSNQAAAGVPPLEADPAMRGGNVADPRRAVEEVAVALAALRWGGGDFLRTLRAGVVYGRDCDSIAGMALSLWGALHGPAGIPPALLAGVGSGSRRELLTEGRSFAEVCRRIHADDTRRWTARVRALGCARPGRSTGAAG